MNISDIHIILQFIQITSTFDRFHHSEVILTAAKYEHYIQWLDNNYTIMNCFFYPSNGLNNMTDIENALKVSHFIDCLWV